MLASINLSVRGAPLRASEQIIGGSHVEAGEDRGHDSEDTFATLFHPAVRFE
jgi:hypothetical protein